MGKYRTNSSRRPTPPRNRVPPLMRGLGCITMVLVPVFSYGLAVYWIENGLPGTQLIPPGWMGPPTIPPLLLNLQGPVMVPIWTFLQAQQNLTANLAFALAIAFIIGGFMAIIYGYIFSMFGPSKYGPQDVPPPRVKTKKYTR